MTKDANEVEVVYTTNDYLFWRNCKWTNPMSKVCWG